MWGIKYMIDDLPMSVYFRPPRGGRSGYWFGTYYENGRRKERYLGSEDPRTRYPRMVPARSRRRHTISVPWVAYDTLLNITLLTDEYMSSMITRMAKEELARQQQRREGA
jgi:hypothetical protein